MSLAKVQYVKSAAKDQGKCVACGDPLPKGSAYRWWTVGFRSHYKYKRCMKPSCTPARSELESSALSSVMAAQEVAEATISDIETWDMGQAGEVGDALQTALSEVADAGDEVVQQWRDAAEAFGGTGDSADRADELEGVLSTARDWQPDSDAPDGCAVHESLLDGCPDCASAFDVWLMDTVESAREAVSEVA